MKTELANLFLSVIEQDNAPVVICDLNHIIVFMNQTAKKRYKSDLTGKSIFDCHNEKSKELIVKVVEWFKKDKANNKVYTFYNEKENKDVYMVALRGLDGTLTGYYEKHEYRNRETEQFYKCILDN